ncbi:MAG: hypothetical protein LLG06_04075 [Desulfobacteraceae bacterium]|nr:hypothetical protein [Desulfobacteraceae bacterium]
MKVEQNKTVARMKAIAKLADMVLRDPGVKYLDILDPGARLIQHWVTPEFFDSVPGRIFVEPVSDDFIGKSFGEYFLYKTLDERVAIYIYASAYTCKRKAEMDTGLVEEAQAA